LYCHTQVKVEIDGIKADRQFMKAAKKYSKQVRPGL
jgi:hypothetical protein